MPAPTVMVPLNGVAPLPLASMPRYPLTTFNQAIGTRVIPIFPLPNGLGGAGSFAMGFAPLVLPFAALLSWWLR